MKLKTGPTEEDCQEHPRCPSAGWAPLSASARPRGLTSTRRHRSPSARKPQEDRSQETGGRTRSGHVRGQQRPLLDDGRDGVRRRRRRELPWRQDALGRRHDRGRDDAQIQSAYVPSLIRRNTNWIFHAGKPVHLLREPGGPVWVLQEYTKAVDPSLTPDNLNTVGGKLKNLPKGWKFETKVLTEDLSLDTGRCGGWAAIIRDELHCTYQGCGYGKDTSANRLRARNNARQPDRQHCGRLPRPLPLSRVTMFRARIINHEQP